MCRKEQLNSPSYAIEEYEFLLYVKESTAEIFIYNKY
jgi:hypothetical protein